MKVYQTNEIKNVERKLENKEKKSNSKDSVTKLCFTADIKRP